MADDKELSLTDAERAEVLARRAARAASAVDIDSIKAGMTPEQKRRVAEKILELWGGKK